MRNELMMGLGLCLLFIAVLVCIEIRKRIRLVHALKLGIKEFTDIHSHILPGVDDGSPYMRTTVKMIETAYREGVRSIIATPHYRRGHKRKSLEVLQSTLEETRQAVKIKCPDMKLYLGNEIFYDDSILRRLNDGRILTLAGTKYILVEFRGDISFNNAYQAMITLLRERYIPIVAHVERYESIMKDVKHLEELRRIGVLIQMNAESVKQHKRIIKKGYIDFLATDCHDLKKRKVNMQKGVQWLYRNCNPALVKKILVENPKLILEDK